MLPFLLYFGAGLLTSLHLYVLLSLTVFGAPPNVLEFISLFGSICMLVASYVSLLKPYVAAKLALPAALANWCFYAPGIVATLKAGRHHQIPELRIVALPYVAVALLVLVTVYSAAVSSRIREVGKRRSWFFPDSTRRSARIIIGACSITIAVSLSVWFSFGRETAVHRSSRFLIPDGYVGWVRIEFQVPGTPLLPVEGGQYVFQVPADGVLRTSSPEQYGWGHDQYYYTSGNDLHLLATGDAAGRLVWGQINGEAGGPAGLRKYEEFFVGNVQQFKEQAGQRRVGPIPVDQRFGSSARDWQKSMP